jgi:hypothetical protein
MPSPTSTAEITTLYEDVLFRDPDTGGLNFWANILDSGLLNLPEITNIFINSPEEVNTVDPLIRLYVGLFGRAPDVDGLRHWVSQADSGVSLNTIVQFFLNSPEFANDYNGGVLGPIPANVASEFITTLYYNFLGRAPDATGLHNYLLALGTPTLQTEANVVIGFLNSTEFLNDVETGVVSWVVSGLNAGGVYPADIVNTAFTVQLTTGNDSVIGASNVSGSLTNYSFDGIGPTLNGGDIVANVVNLTLTDSYGQGVDIIPQGAQLSNITNIILNTAGNAGDYYGTGTFFDVSGVSNLQTVTVNSQGDGVDEVNAGALTNVNVTHSNTGGYGDSGYESSSSDSSYDYYGGVVVTGGHNVTVTNSGAGGVVIGSDNFEGFAGVPLTSELPTGNVVVNQNAAVTGDVEVFGGVNVTVNVTSDSYNGYVDIGNTDDNTGNFGSGGNTNPTGAIVVVDAAEFGGNATYANDTWITVFGGVGTDTTPAVSITAAGDAISVGDSDVVTPSNQPDGDVVIVDTAPLPWGDDYNGDDDIDSQFLGQEEDIYVSGGHNVTITTNTGDVYVGDYDTYLNANDTALTGSQPSGAVNITDTATATYEENTSVVDIHVYGGVGSEGEGGVAAITVTATDANICVGAIVWDAVNSIYTVIGPAGNATGDVVLTDGSSANIWDTNDNCGDITGTGAEGDINVIGGHNITITTYVGDVTVGDDYLNVAGTAPLAGEEPAGAVNVSDFATATSTYTCDDCTYYESAVCIVIYGGTGTVSVPAVTVVATDANIQVGTIEDGVVIAPAGGATGNITITDGTSSSVWDGTATGAAEGDISVLGGNVIDITTYVGDVTVGGDDLNSAETAPLTGEEPTGAVVINDFATDPCANVTVYGGTSVEVTASGASVDIGTVDGSIVIAPSSIVIVTDTATNPYDRIINCFDNDVNIVGGTSVTVNTNAGGVHIGTSSGTAGSEPSGAISVTDLATGLFADWCCDSDDITIYGGVGSTGNWAVQVEANDSSVYIGNGTAATDPTGGLGVSITITGVQTANQYDNVIFVAGVGGGGGVTINTTGAADNCDYDAIQVGTPTEFSITTTYDPSSNIYYTGGTVTTAGTQSGAVSITDTHSGWNYSTEDVLVIGPTTVNINVGLIDDCSTITVGSCPITNGTGQVYLNFADDAMGNVSITQSGIENIYNCETDTFSLVTVYGQAYDTVYVHGVGTQVSLTGGDGATIVDVNSLRVEGGPNKGQIVGSSTVNTVSLDGVTGCITITANALTTLNISDTGCAIGVEPSIFIENSAPTLALTINLSNATDVSVTDEGLFNPATLTSTPTIVGTVTFTTGPSSAPDAIDIDLPLASALVFNNTAELTIDSNFPNVVTITAEGSGQLNLGDLTGSDFAHLKTINASAATGGVSVEITGLQTSFAGGSGNDVVTIDNYTTTNPTLMSIDGGAGTNTVVLTNIASYYGPTDAIVFSGQHFQTLEVDLNGDSASTNGAPFFGAAGFAHLIAGDAGTDGIAFTQVAAGVDLTLIDSNTQTPSGTNPTLDGYATIGYELATYSATGQLNLTMGTAHTDGITDAVATGAGGGLDPALNGSTLTGSIPIVSITSTGDGYGSNELYLTDAAYDASGPGGNFTGTTTIDIGGNEDIDVYDTDGTVTTINASASTADWVDVTGVVTADATFTGGSATLYASADNVSPLNLTPYQDHDVFNLGTGGGWVVVGAGGAGGPDAYFDANTGSEIINLTVNSPIGTTVVAPDVGFVGPSSADYGVYATVNNFTFGTVANHDTASTFVLGAYSIGENETYYQVPSAVIANSTSGGIHGINSDTSVIYYVIDGMVVPTGNPTLTGSAEFADVQAIIDAGGEGTVGFAVIPSYGSGTVANTTYIIEDTGGGAADTVIALPGVTTATGFGIGVDPSDPGYLYNFGAGTSLNLGIDETSPDGFFAGVAADNGGSATGATYNDGFTLGSTILGLYAKDTLSLSGTGTNVYQNMANWAILEAVSATGGSFSGNGNVTVTQTGVDPVLIFDVETSGVVINTFTYGNASVANDDPLLVIQLTESLTINTLIDQSGSSGAGTGTEILVESTVDPDLTIGVISDVALVTFDASYLDGALTLGTNADPIGSGLGGNSVNNGLTILASTEVEGCGAVIYASGNSDVIQAGSICDLEGGNSQNGGVIIGAAGTADAISVYLDSSEFGPGALIGAAGNGDTITLVGGACEMPCFFTPSGDAQTASGVLSAAGTVESAYDLAYITLGGTEGNDGCPLGAPTFENASDTSLGANTVVNIGDCSGCVDTQAIVWLGPDNTVNLSGNCDTTADVWVTSDYANSNGHAGTSADFSFETVNWQGGNLNLYFYNEPTESWASGCASTSIVNVASASTLASAIDTAAGEAVVLDNNFNGGTNTSHSYSINGATGLVDWFQYGGNTYIVEANNDAATPAAHASLQGHDVVVELIGLVNVSDVGVFLSHVSV